MRCASGASRGVYKWAFFLQHFPRKYSNMHYNSPGYTFNSIPLSETEAERATYGKEEGDDISDHTLDCRNALEKETSRITHSSSHSHSSLHTPQCYRRRSSDPQTFREKGVFHRDHMYGKYRPLLDAPWRSLPKKTYLDDAERLYGRLETWVNSYSSPQHELLWENKGDHIHKKKNHTEMAKKVAILRDFLRDTLSAARLEIKTAKKYYHRCVQESLAYQDRLKSAEDDPGSLFMWAERHLKSIEMRKKSKVEENSGSSVGGSGNEKKEALLSDFDDKSNNRGAAGVGRSRHVEEEEKEKEEEERDAERMRIRARRLRGEKASLATSPATDETPGSLSAFPFLRKRALENESSLDPSLVEWTMRYFPEDNEKMFAEVPRQGAASAEDHTDSESSNASPSMDVSEKHRGTYANGEESDGPEDGPSSGRRRRGKGLEDHLTQQGQQRHHRFLPHSLIGGLPHGRQRLESSLRAHEDWRRATFDAEGVYYHVRPPSNSEEDDEVERRKPKPIKGSDAFLGEVVKVPWNVVATARKKGYSSEILRAKERLLRLSRGEDPATIP